MPVTLDRTAALLRGAVDAGRVPGLVAAVDDISSAPRLGDAYETSARLAAGPARVCYTHRMRACAWDAWPTPLV